MKLRQKIELQIFRQCGHFCGADGVEDHLKHNPHLADSVVLLARRDFF
jgi:hypothetical protein